MRYGFPMIRGEFLCDRQYFRGLYMRRKTVDSVRHVPKDVPQGLKPS